MPPSHRALPPVDKMCPIVGVAAGILLGLGPALGFAQSDAPVNVQWEGEILHDKDLSGAAVRDRRLVIGADEGSTVQVLERVEADRYRVVRNIPLLPAGSDELDIEAIAMAGQQVYVAGSHAWVRKKIEYPDDEDERSYAANRRRLAEITTEESRNHLLRFALSTAGERASTVDSINLRPLLASDPYLRPFLTIPAKEGGIDIEGLAADGDTLYVGFRGPVLRENYVPVMKLRFDRPEDYELLFVNLEGYGIRDLLKVSGGILVLAGPVGDGRGKCELYFWDGQDCLPGKDRPPAALHELGKLNPADDGNPEAIALLGETDEAWSLLVLSDGANEGAPRRVQIEKPVLSR